VVKIICPECRAKSSFQSSELTLFTRIQCEKCGAVLEVIEEDPVELEVIEGPESSDDDYEEDDG